MVAVMTGSLMWPYIYGRRVQTVKELATASFPGSRVWTEKKKSLVHTVHDQFLKLPQNLLCYSTNLCEMCQLLPCETPATNHTLCGRWQKSDKGNKLFAYKNYQSVPAYPIFLFVILNTLTHYTR